MRARFLEFDDVLVNTNTIICIYKVFELPTIHINLVDQGHVSEEFDTQAECDARFDELKKLLVGQKKTQHCEYSGIEFETSA